MERESDGDNKGLVWGLEELEIRERTDSIQSSIVAVTQNTEKSPSDLRRLAVT